MMLAIGLSRQTNAYISNIIPWRPPGNRNPSSAEIALCMPFIQRHIELVSPKIIITLGSTSFTSLVNTTETISKARGCWHTYQTPKLSAPILLMPVFHPAFLLRTPAQKKSAWRDFLNIAQKLQELTYDINS
jgi:DNA polymerase